jgi:hypothetical protein
MNPSPHSQEHQAVPPEDDVRTPPWLTATGIGLFMLAGVGWLMTRPPQPTIEQMREPAPQAAQAPETPASASAAVARPRGSAPESARPALRMPRPAKH